MPEMSKQAYHEGYIDPETIKAALKELPFVIYEDYDSWDDGGGVIKARKYDLDPVPDHQDESARSQSITTTEVFEADDFRDDHEHINVPFLSHDGEHEFDVDSEWNPGELTFAHNSTSNRWSIFVGHYFKREKYVEIVARMIDELFARIGIEDPKNWVHDDTISNAAPDDRNKVDDALLSYGCVMDPDDARYVHDKYGVPLRDALNETRQL